MAVFDHIAPCLASVICPLLIRPETIRLQATRGQKTNFKLCSFNSCLPGLGALSLTAECLGRVVLPIAQLSQQPYGSGTPNENSDRHHARFSAVFVVLLPASFSDGFEIIETARGSFESHPSCACSSSQEIACLTSLISHRNVACICSVAAEMPISP